MPLSRVGLLLGRVSIVCMWQSGGVDVNYSRESDGLLKTSPYVWPLFRAFIAYARYYEWPKALTLAVS